MPLAKHTGLVIESRRLGEADQEFTLLCDTGLKKKFISKGIQKSKSRTILATELGSKVSVDSYDHARKEIFHCKEIHLEERFENAKSDYIHIVTLNSFCEITRELTPEGEAEPINYLFLLAAIEALNKYSFQTIILPFFKLRLLANNGYISKKFYCNKCEEELVEYASLEAQSLSFYCKNCKPNRENSIGIHNFFRKMFTTKYEDLIKEHWNPELIAMSDEVLNTFLKSSLNLKLKSLELLYQQA
ncbi:MAG: DNA repair protein RecO [Leptospiraceae bacterium]|nr:DNA repair protein RecO [Leptospiraceae bacterium]